MFRRWTSLDLSRSPRVAEHILATIWVLPALEAPLVEARLRRGRISLNVHQLSYFREPLTENVMVGVINFLDTSQSCELRWSNFSEASWVKILRRIHS